MDKLVFSEKALNQQFCSKCLNYLSVGPVLVSRDGQVVCGRCSKSLPSADKIYSLYNLVAEKLVFKCINHYAGCEELFFFNEATEHEKHCQKKLLACPFCAFEGNGCQLVHHFEKEHSEGLLKDTVQIIVTNKFSKKIVVTKNNRILCVAVFVNDTFIEIYNLLITPSYLDREYFSLRLFKRGSNVQFVTPPIRMTQDRNSFPLKENAECRKNCFTLDRAEILNCFPSEWCLCEVDSMSKPNSEYDGENLNIYSIIRKMDEKLSTNVAEAETNVEGEYGEDFNLIDRILMMSIPNLRKFVNSELYKWQKCGNCKRCINGASFYLCSKNHMSCLECTNKKCPKCGLLRQWTKNSIVYTRSLICEWKGCHKHENIFQYMAHKQDCKYREYICPDRECGFVASLDSLKSHWHLAPIESRIDVSVSPKHRGFYWLVWGNELFFVITAFENVSRRFFISISEVDVVMHKRFGFDLFLIDKKNSGAVCKTKCDKTRYDLSGGTESICIVKFLKEEDLEKEFMLRWIYR